MVFRTQFSSSPGFDEVNAALAENPTKRKKMKDLIPHKKLVDVNFWSEKCEIRFPKRRILADSDSEEDFDDSEDEDASVVAITTRATKQVMYFLTDSERFMPPKKKPKTVTKVYRMVWLKSTTPEELYARKIDAEEYGEALALAQAYGLDCDLVYQRQWRKSPVSLASIQDYLSKISKRAWVLHECLERVPENIDAARELLQYGLRGTDLPALAAIVTAEDAWRFMLCDPEEGLYEDLDYDRFDPAAVKRFEDKKKEIREAQLAEIDFEKSAVNLENLDLGAFLYENSPELMKYRVESPSVELVQQWYEMRACQIEEFSRLVDYALEFTKLAIQRGFDGLGELLDDLVTMETLVYECGVGDSLTFAALRDMPDYARIELMMDKVANPVVQCPSDLMEFALEVIYTTERDDQLDVAMEIFQCLPQKTTQKESADLVRLHKEVDRMERHLRAAKILQDNNIKKTVAFIKSSEIFVESLLCSGSQDNIRLAGDMMERQRQQGLGSISGQGRMRRLEYDIAVTLVLTAAREYFDSSANLTHTLRLCKDRLELVRQAVGSKPTNYRQSQKLLRLAHLLRVDAKDSAERDGKVLLVLAQAALAADDTEFAHQYCQRLVTASFGPAWTVCVDLAEKEAFKDIAAKVSLLSFAVTFCSVEMIEPILQARSLLQRQTGLALEVSQYYYALQVYAALRPCPNPHPASLYLQPPSRIAQLVMLHLKAHPEREWPPAVSPLVPLLMQCRTRLQDWHQAQALQRLAPGVDVVRFTQDAEYKKETILGSCEEEVYGMAVSLAERYQLPLWDIYMAHLEYLFSDSGLSTEELRERISRLNILDTLKQQPSEFCSRLYTHVYPTVAGSDHARLLYLFGLLEGLDKERHLCGLPATEHIKLLKKLKPLAADIDYVRLIDDKTPPKDILAPYLTSANINNVMKLASKIPDKAAWIHRYELCGEYIQKLLPDDFVTFIRTITCSRDSSLKLEVSCRQEIVRRAIKFCQQQEGRKKKEGDAGTEEGWREAGMQVQPLQVHLETLDSDTVQSFMQAEDPKFHQYALHYDVSCGDPVKVGELLVLMVVEGQPLELADDLVQVAPPIGLTVADILQKALARIITALRGQLAGRKEVFDVLHPFITDTTVPMQQRLAVLELLEMLLQLWPPFSEGSGEQPPWTKTLLAMACSTNAASVALIDTVLKDLGPADFPLNIQDTKVVFDALLRRQCPIEGVKVILRSGHKKLYPSAVLVLSAEEEVGEDSDLIHLVLRRELAPQLVGTPIYLHICKAVVRAHETQGPAAAPYLQLETVVGQLQEAGLQAEARSLTQQAHATRPLFQSVGSALGMMGHVSTLCTALPVHGT
nr:hypothetical protein BaRGS_008557 [Batillaria attramentaria]